VYCAVMMSFPGQICWFFSSHKCRSS